MQILRQSTEVVVRIGPFVDVTDGFTPEVGVSLATADEAEVLKAGGAATTSIAGATWAAVTGADGWYDLTLTTAHTDTVGPLTVVVHDDSVCLPVFTHFQVIEENAYDWLYASAANPLQDVSDIHSRLVVVNSDTTAIHSDTTIIASDLVQVYSDTTAIHSETTVIQSDTTVIESDTTVIESDVVVIDQDTSDILVAVDGIAVGAGGISASYDSFTKTTGGTETNSATDTRTLNGVVHIVPPSAGNTEFYYEFDVGTDGIVTEFLWNGYVQTIGDTVTVWAYNWGATAWDQIGTLDGLPGTTIGEHAFIATNAYTGTGSNSGKARIRFLSTTSTAVATDRVLAEYTQLRAGIPNGTTITLTASAANSNYIGRGWTLALGGQAIEGAYFFQAISVSGTGTGSNGSPYIFQECNIGTTTLAAYGFIDNCALTDVVTLTSTGGVSADALTFIDCASGVAGSGAPSIDASGVTKTTAINVRRWSGGLTVTLTADCTMSIDAVSGGTITVNGTGGSINIRGMVEAVTDNSSGAVTITQSAAINNSFIADQVWDEAMSGHVAAGSFGQAVSDLESNLVIVDTVVDAILVDTATLSNIDSQLTVTDAVVDTIYSDTTILTSDTVKVDSDLSKIASQLVVIDDFLDTEIATIASQVLISQSEISQILSDTTAIEAQVGSPIATGTADSGTTTTIVDAERTEADNNYWKGLAVKFTSGTISGQVREITAFDAATDTITFAPATTQAVTTNTYEIIAWATAFSTAQDSKLTKITSEVDVIQSDIASVDSQLTVTDAVVDTIYSDTAVITSDTAVIEAAVSDVESFLLLIDSAITVIDDFLDTEIATIISDITEVRSDTAVIESNTQVIEASVSDIESHLIVTDALITTVDDLIDTEVATIISDIALLQVDLDTTTSDLVKVDSDLSKIASQLLIVKSDTSDIKSAHVVVNSDLSKVLSDLVEIRSDTTAIEATGASLSAAQDSKLTEIHTDVNTVASDVVLIDADTSNIKSALLVIDDLIDNEISDIKSALTVVDTVVDTIASDLLLAQVDLDTITSDLVVIDQDLSDVKSDLVVIDDLIDNEVSDIKSQLTIVASDIVKVDSDLSKILSDLVIADSDLSKIASDLILVDDLIDNEVSDIRSAIVVLQTNVTTIASDVVEIYSDTTIIASDVAQIYSDTTIIASDLLIAASDILTAPIRKNAALANFTFLMVDATDGFTPETGLSVTGNVSIDGAAFASLTNSVSEVSNGIYKVNLAAADLNGDIITLRFTATGAADRFITLLTTA